MSPNKSTPTSGDFMTAIGHGATTSEVAEKLGISIKVAQKNLQSLRSLKYIKQLPSGQWRKL